MVMPVVMQIYIEQQRILELMHHTLHMTYKCGINLFSINFLFDADPAPVQLTYYKDRQVKSKLQTLANVQTYNEVLLFEMLAGGFQSVKDNQQVDENMLSITLR